MPARPVRLRERAAVDIDQAVDYYLAEADPDVALRFVDAVERAVGDDVVDVWRILHTGGDIPTAIGSGT